MLCWLNFLIACFWATLFSLATTSRSFFSLLICAEVAWSVLYALAAASSLVCDDLNLFSMTFFILGFAAAELAVGLLLAVLMKFAHTSGELKSVEPTRR